MLRMLVLALALANAGYYAWTEGWLDTFIGTRANAEREPERLTRQVQPESVQILPSSAANPGAAPATTTAPSPAPAAVSAAATEPLACLEAGPFSAAELAAATSAAQAALPSGAWTDVKTERPGAWLVYMGRYGDRELLAKKKEELGRIKLAFEDVRNAPSLEPGLSLGRYDNRAAAEKGLAQFALRGVHSAKVVELGAGSTTHLLRVDKADAALVALLAGLRSEGLGKGFVPCAKTALN